MYFPKLEMLQSMDKTYVFEHAEGGTLRREKKNKRNDQKIATQIGAT